jgi:hypothetical protein
MQVADAAEVMNSDDIRMDELCEGAGFPVEAFGEAWSFCDGRRQDFERDEAIEGWLARFIDGTHTAFTDEGQDFELGKKFGDVLDGWRSEARIFISRFGAGAEAGFDEALRAESELDIGRQGFLTSRAGSVRIHIMFPSTLILGNDGHRLRQRLKKCQPK